MHGVSRVCINFLKAMLFGGALTGFSNSRLRHLGDALSIRDTTGLTTENKELKLRLQAMEQQAHLRDALNEALREEVQRLKIATGQIPAANGNPFGRGLPPQFPPHQPAVHHFGGLQTQQQQRQMPQSLTNNQTHSGQSRPSFETSTRGSSSIQETSLSGI